MALTSIVSMMLDQEEIEIVINSVGHHANAGQLFEEVPTNPEGSFKLVERMNLLWSKNLEDLPVFTMNEIERHRQLSGKLKGKLKGLPITKTLVRGRKFLQDGYLKSNTMFLCSSNDYVKIKCKCQASMKNILRDIIVTIDRHTSEVTKSHCTCPAGLSGYCNHVMALLLQLATFSLLGITKIPGETACTSMARQWGVPGDKEFPRAPIMSTSISKDPTKRGITSTLYDPHKIFDTEAFYTRVNNFKTSLWKENPLIGFSHCVPTSGFSYVGTTHGMFLLGSPLSFHLQAMEKRVFFCLTFNLASPSPTLLR